MAHKFGTFKKFLEEHDDVVDRKRKLEVERIIKSHYEKYGSSEEESEADGSPKKSNV